MTDRTTQPSALPAEFAERASDPIDYADRVAWSRARDRYRKLERPMPKIEHIKLSGFQHVLVVDGTRGPFASTGKPATHPAGFGRFLSDDYVTPEELRGRLFRFDPSPCSERAVHADPEVERSLNAYFAIVKAADEQALALYPEEKKP